jgi:hypothetical protein
MGVLTMQAPGIDHRLLRRFVQDQEPAHFVLAAVVVLEVPGQMPVDVDLRAVDAVPGQVGNVVARSRFEN